jgi:hypothetical protein
MRIESFRDNQRGIEHFRAAFCAIYRYQDNLDHLPQPLLEPALNKFGIVDMDLDRGNRPIPVA